MVESVKICTLNGGTQSEIKFYNDILSTKEWQKHGYKDCIHSDMGF